MWNRIQLETNYGFTDEWTDIVKLEAGAECINPLSDYARFDNPYAQVEFDGLVHEIVFQDLSLLLDLGQGIREFEGP
jgi:hypothetical protein